MPKIENSFAKKDTLDFTSLHLEFSIFVHNLARRERSEPNTGNLFPSMAGSERLAVKLRSKIKIR